MRDKPDKASGTPVTASAPISVVIPTSGAEKFLRETLCSVFSQTLKPEEIVIVDDASTDRTVELISAIRSSSPIPIRLDVLAQNSGGPSAPTNRAVDLACGDFIALLDHDDVMLPDKLARQSAVLVAHPEIDFVLSDYEHFDSKGALPESKARQWEPEGHGMLFQQSGQDLRVLDPLTSLKAFVKRPGLALSCSSYFFRKDLWRRVGGFDHQYMPVADYDFLLRAVDKPIVWLDRVLFRKRVHDSNHWRSYVADPARKWRSEQSVARAQRAMLKRFPRDPILRTLVANHSGYVASGFIGIGEYTAALGEAMQLLKLRNVRNAACILARLLASAARRGRKAASKADSAAHHAAGL